MSTFIPPIDLSAGGGGPIVIPPIDLSVPSGAPRSRHVDTGLGSFLHGIKEGAIATAESLPDIAIAAATHPQTLITDTAKGLYEEGKWTATLGRAFTNLAAGDVKDFRKFYDAYEQHFYANPFGTSLFILGGGRGIGGRVGALRELGPAGRAVTSKAARAALLGWDTPDATRYISVGLGSDIKGVGQQGERIATKRLGRSHFNANRAYATDALLKQLPSDFPLLGEARRAARATRSEGRTPYLRLLSAPEYIDYQKTYRALTRSEQAAAGLRNKLPFRRDVDTWIEKLKLIGSPEADAQVRLLEEPQLRKLFEQPTERILKHEAAGTALEPLRRKILIETGALTEAEAEAAPWRLTRQLRGAHLATPAWIYKQRRKIDSYIRQIETQKGRLVPAVKAFGSADRRSALKAARQASLEAIKESGVRADIYETLSRKPSLQGDVSALRRDIAQAETRLAERRRVLAEAETALEGIVPTEAQRAALDAQRTKITKAESALQRKQQQLTEATTEPDIPGRQLIDAEPEVQRHVSDVYREIDDAYDEKEALKEDMDMVMSGEMTTAFLDKHNMTPAGGWGKTEQAMAEAVHKLLRKEHADELKELERQLKLAKQRRLPSKILDAMGLRIPSDIVAPTEAQLAEATRVRAQMEAIKQRLKEAKRFRLNDAEKTRMAARIESMRKEILALESPRAIKRAPSSHQRRFESRYQQAERKLQKRIAEKQQVLKEIGDEVGFAGPDPRENQRMAVLGLYNRRWRRAVVRYERAVRAEQALADSVLRQLDAKERQASSEQELARIRDAKIKFIQGQRLRLEDLNDAIDDQVALRNEIQSSLGKLVGGGEPWELALEARRGNRPIPYYTPDEMLTEGARRRMGAAEGSILAPREGADVYRSRSILMRTGLLALHPDTLSPAYFRAAKHALNTAMHARAMALATRIGKDVALPKGYEYLRRTRGETISETAKHRGEHLRIMEDEFGREEDLSTTDTKAEDIDFTNADGSEYRLIIPKAYADEFRSEGLKSQTAVGRIFTRSMDVWRSLVLHLRVPWLESNVIGNTFLFAMRFAGLRGLTEFARMVASNPVSRKYIPAMRRLALEHLNEEQVRQIFPEQVRGTHFETQAPELPNITPRRIRDPLEESPTGKRFLQGLSEIPRLLPRADKAYERKLRAAATNAVLRSSPEVKEIYRTMKREGSGDFHDAVTKAIEGDEHFREWVVQEVNDTLGNFLSLTRSERSALRRVVPFYAWMREITRLAGRMLVDHPGRVLLLSQLAQATSEMRPEELPNYMGGTVLAEKTGWLQRLIGGAPRGLEAALALHTMSPYSTLSDELSAASALLPGSTASNVREFAGNFNPAIAGLYSISAQGREGNLLSRYAEELVRSVPQSQLFFPYDSNLYPKRDRLDIAFKLLGSPKIQFDPAEASYQQFQGR